VTADGKCPGLRALIMQQVVPIKSHFFFFFFKYCLDVRRVQARAGADVEALDMACGSARAPSISHFVGTVPLPAVAYPHRRLLAPEPGECGTPPPGRPPSLPSWTLWSRSSSLSMRDCVRTLQHQRVLKQGLDLEFRV
jgi:hypothetical protein